MFRSSTWLLALISVLCALPVAAQENPRLARSRISITPIVGYRIGQTAEAQITISTSETPFPVTATIEEVRSGGPFLGGQLEVLLFGPLSLVGSVAYSRPDNVSVIGTATDVPGARPDTITAAAPDVLLAKAGLSIRLPDPTPDSRSFHPAAFLTIAPGLLRESGVLGFPGTSPVNHFALAIGGEAVTKLGADWVALTLGVEDFITFWYPDGRERAEERALAAQGFQDPRVSFSYDPSHIILLRAGLSFRF